MITHATTSPHDRIPLSSLGPFTAVTFGLAWGILALFIFLPDLMTGLVGPLTGDHPLFFLAVYAPAIAALAAVLHRTGPAGARRFLTRLTSWECPKAWALFLVFGVPLVFYAGAALNGKLVSDPFPFDSAPSLATALLLAAIKGPVEEIGWRGYALPMLQRRFAPVWASLILGAVWGFWHLPAFLLSGTQQSAWSFTPFLLGTIAISIIATSLFNASRGGILPAAVLHYQLMNPVWPDAQPYDTYILLAVAAVIIVRDRRLMFSRRGAVTEIVPEAKSDA